MYSTLASLLSFYFIAFALSLSLSLHRRIGCSRVSRRAVGRQTDWLHTRLGIRTQSDIFSSVLLSLASAKHACCQQTFSHICIHEKPHACIHYLNLYMVFSSSLSNLELILDRPIYTAYMVEDDIQEYDGT